MDNKRDIIKICIFLDGIGYDSILSSPPLKNILPTLVPIETVLGFSSAAQATILTGKYPQEHGQFSMYYFSPNPTLPKFSLKVISALPYFITRRKKFKTLLALYLRLLHPKGGYFGLFEIPPRHLSYISPTEKRNIYKIRGVHPHDTIIDYWYKNHLNFRVFTWEIPEEYSFQQLLQLLPNTPLERVFLCCTKGDHLGHKFGPFSKEVKEYIEKIRQYIEKLLEVCNKLYKNVSLYIFSDHGMIEVKEAIKINVVIEQLTSKYRNDCLIFIDATMLRIFTLNPKKREALRCILEEIPHGKVLSDEDLKTFKCLFPSKKFGDLIFLCDPGYVLLPNFFGDLLPRGMHGYDPNAKDYATFFGCNKKLSSQPLHISQITPLLK